MHALLAAESGLDVAGEATSGEEAVAMAADLQPDVVLMDIQMPGLSGIEATRRILHTSPHIRVLVVTMFEDDQSVFMAMRAGARGCVLKGVRPEDMLHAIQTVGHSGAIFSPSIATRVLEFFGGIQPAAFPHALPELTDREREILDLIAKGQSNAAIAKQLVLSPKTVSNYVSNIFSKLQVADRAQAMLRAREAGLG
jgi:DNA-binding NarL/FixJ family response regulator